MSTKIRLQCFLTLLFAMTWALPSQAVQTTYTDEATYFADLASQGYISVADGFEDNDFWGLLETDLAPNVTSQGVTWTGLGGGVTLKRAVERSGDWGLESSPPGWPIDGFLASSSEPLYGVGGWVKAGNAGSGGQNDVSISINGSPLLDEGFGAPTSNYVFWGIIDSAGINSIQLETEPVEPPEPGSGDPMEPSKTLFFDDFTFGFTAAPSLREPGIAWNNAAGGNYSSSNWNGDTAPAIAGNGVFHLGSSTAYTVSFSQDETASQAVIANDKVAFDLGGFQYSLTQANITRESLIVGERPGDIGELTLSNGSIAGANVVVAHSTASTGHLTVDTGTTVDLTGAIRVGSGGTGTLDINPGAVVSSGSTGVTYGGIVGQLNGTGTVNVAGAGTEWNINSLKTLAIGLGGTGTLNISDGASVSAWQLVAGAKAGNGLLGEPTGVGSINVSGPGSTLSGNITIAQDGPASMNITGGGQVTGRNGSIAVSADADVVLDGPNSNWTIHINGSSRGTLNVGVGDQIGSFATIPPPPTVEGTLTIQNGASVVNEEAFIGKTRKGRGTLTVTGPGSSWASGTQFSGNTFVGFEGDGVLNVLDGATIQTGQTMIGRHGLRDQLRGVANISGAGSTWNTPSTIWVGFNNDPQIYSGAFLFFAEGVLNVSDGGVVNAGRLAVADRKISKGVVNISGAGSTVSVDSVTLGKQWTTTFTFGSNAEMTLGAGGLLDVTQDIDIYHGLLTLDGGTINAANLRLHGEQLVDPATNSSETGDTRVTFIGDGQINADVINDGGFVEPGQGVGLLSMTGDFSQALDGTLKIELGGADNSDPLNPQYDQLLIDGSATLAGTLDVSLVDLGSGLFAPVAGDSFGFLSATGGFGGAFGTTNLPTLSAGLQWLFHPVGNTLFLNVVGAPSADFDTDGDVDAADLAQWESSFGMGNGADTDTDGDSDGTDFLAWQRQFSGPVPNATGLASPQTIPEPSSLLLVTCCALLLICRKGSVGFNCETLLLHRG